MKYFFFILMVACTAVNVSAQEIVKVFFKSQSQIKDTTKVDTDSIPYIIVDPSGTIINNPPEMIVDTTCLQSLKQHIFVLCQDYCLYDKKKKKLYGYNDNPQFGTTYSLGIKCKGYNLISDEAVHPWEYDTHYNEFKSDKLIPILSNSKYFLLDDSERHSYTESDSIVSAVQTVKDKYLFTAKSFTSLQNGIDINVSDTCKTGVLVWVMKKSGDLATGDMKIEFDYVPTKVEMFGSVVITPPHRDAEVLGCLLVTKNENDNQTYYLSGVAACRNDVWTLYYPFKGFKFNSKSPNTPIVKGRLTEIKPINK